MLEKKYDYYANRIFSQAETRSVSKEVHMKYHLSRRAAFFSKLACFLCGFALGCSSIMLGVILFVLAIIFDLVSGVLGKSNFSIDNSFM